MTSPRAAALAPYSPTSTPAPVRGGIQRAEQVGAVWLAVFALVGACAGGSEAGGGTGSAAPTPSPAATTGIPTPTPTPERRDDADGNPVFDPPQETLPGVDLAGAKQAAIDFMDAYFRGHQAGDATYLREHSEQGCEYCADRVEEIEETADRGLRLSPDFTWRITNVGAIPPDGDVPLHSVVLEWATSDYVLVDEAGAAIETHVGDDDFTMLVALRPVEVGWRVVSVDVINDEFSRQLREHYADVMG